jgi:formylglycine-generating enzyme required for sulfatase activity
MGSLKTESLGNEDPQHNVTIAKPFAVAKYELTFAEWDACVAHGDCVPHVSDSGWGRGRQPAINVSWDDAQSYVAWLSRITGKEYRLLSEAEYEYAARAGTQTAYPWGNKIGKNNANCSRCGSQWDNKQTAPVGSFAANGFGLYDMVGNVYEWVEDCYHDSYNGAPADGAAWTGGDCITFSADREKFFMKAGYGKNFVMRVIRGGSWDNDEAVLRSAHRYMLTFDLRGYYLGFRVGRMLSAGAGAITVAPGAH